MHLNIFRLALNPQKGTSSAYNLKIFLLKNYKMDDRPTIGPTNRQTGLTYKISWPETKSSQKGHIEKATYLWTQTLNLYIFAVMC